MQVNRSRMAELFGSGGALATRFEGFEERPSQAAMAEAIDDLFVRGGRLLVEAGTGTGKTFAYLLPALLHAELPERRVVISTWTRTLQEQLVGRDLPRLRELLGVPLEAVLVQGRENYVCRRRAELALHRNDLLFEGAGSGAQLAEVVEWSARSRVGTRADLGFEPRAEVWAAVRAERGNCLQGRSPHFHSCVWQDAKRRAREAGVLVVNHALLLEDLKLKRAGGAVLPPYSLLIVDEAHHLEEVAADHLGGRFSRASVLGLLRAAARAVETGARGTTREELEHVLSRCRGAAIELFEAAAGWIGTRTVAALEPGARLPASLPLLLQEAHDRLVAAAKHGPDEGAAAELAARATAAGAAAESIGAILDASLREGAARTTDDLVVFAERSEPGGDVALCTAPVEPGPILARELFAPLHAAVLTSATLAVSPPPDRFAWLRRGCGVGEAQALVLDSPFDYRRQSRLVVDPLPEPTDPDAWTAALIERVPVHVRRSDGRAFVLFTSRKTMEVVAAGARAALEEAGIALLVQGRGVPRSKLLQQFREQQPAALFGLASFWEGVDVPGQDLAHVILTRLPFAVPDHPLEKARAERLERAGGNAFSMLSLPKAVLRFKQGFGRLIRTRDDRGDVTVLDARIVQRRYGRAFLLALPDCRKVVLRDGEEVDLDEETAS
jgi:ATP-dependent DNA helicase DinG